MRSTIACASPVSFVHSIVSVGDDGDDEEKTPEEPAALPKHLESGKYLSELSKSLRNVIEENATQYSIARLRDVALFFSANFVARHRCKFSRRRLQTTTALAHAILLCTIVDDVHTDRSSSFLPQNFVSSRRRCAVEHGGWFWIRFCVF